MKFAASFSGGKDSFLSIIKMIESGNELVALIVSTKKNEKSWTHNIDNEYFFKVADIFGCDVFFTDTDIVDYEFNFEKSLLMAKNIGAEACIFGDIDNEPHLNWNRMRCKNVSIKCIMPLLYENRYDVVKEFLNRKIDAQIIKINNEALDEKYLGRNFDLSFINEIKKLECVDVCGENGEYHTRVDLNSISKQLDIIKGKRDK